MSRIRILLVDDHEVVRLGLMTLLNDQPNLQVVGEASTAGEAVKAVERLDPDVVLMDIRLPGEGGIEATRQVTKNFPRSKVIMLTSFADDELIMRAISAGAVGYVLKQVGNEELLRAIDAAAQGKALLDPSVTARLLSQVREAERKSEEDAFRDLSDREMDVLVLVARGRTNAEIGHALNLSEKTVGNYVSTILDKLHLTNRIKLATYAVEHHIFERMGKE
jgi:two-component system response regulator DevR